MQNARCEFIYTLVRRLVMHQRSHPSLAFTFLSWLAKRSHIPSQLAFFANHFAFLDEV